MKKLLLTLLLGAMALGAQTRVFELRTYYTKDGRLPALLERFGSHTTALFEKHGMTNIGYWVPMDKPNQLIYILAHPSIEEAKKNWEAFRTDPEWIKVKNESEASGPIVDKVESVYMTPAAFSKLK